MRCPSGFGGISATNVPVRPWTLRAVLPWDLQILPTGPRHRTALGTRTCSQAHRCKGWKNCMRPARDTARELSPVDGTQSSSAHAEQPAGKGWLGSCRLLCPEVWLCPLAHVRASASWSRTSCEEGVRSPALGTRLRRRERAAPFVTSASGPGGQVTAGRAGTFPRACWKALA